MGRHHDIQVHRRRRTTAALVLSSVLVVAACSGDDDDAGGEPAALEQTAEEPGDDAALAVLTADTAGDGAAEGAIAGSTGTDFDLGVVGRDVIVEMRVVLSSDDVQRTVASVMAAASTLGGGVASSDVNYGDVGVEGDGGFAVLVVKVPPESLDRFLDGLDDTADVRSINQSAEDVTEQLVDLDVRIRNARESVANVREFMDRTENLNELVTLEAELTRRQTDLERLEAQQRNLADRVALSTVTIEIVPTASVPEPVVEEDRTIADAFRDGWDAFSAMIFGLTIVLAALTPFIVAALLAAVTIWAVARRRNAEPLRSAVPSRAPGDLDDGRGDDPGDGNDGGGDDGSPSPAGDREPELTR